MAGERPMTTAPATDGEVEAAATWLEGQAKGKRDFVAHAEANRDDWFATMPPEISENALKEAAEMESAARLLRSLPALRAECAALRSALEELRDWASRIAHDERVCGWLHTQDYSLYCLLADCPVDFAAILDGKEPER